MNTITSVESRYYSRNLKECADRLIYIPYFVLEEPCSKEGVEHFATTPGVFNADKVIVQSEDIRQLYIDVLVEKSNQPSRKYWEEHILGLGSPKIDKVLTSTREDFELPEEWKKLIEGKKVVLYNTSIAATLTNADKVCDKLRYVFDVFRNRDDVVLWWRPHPLMKPTIHASCPQIEAEYLAIEKEYIEEGFGIYDESPDVHRAICFSDAYYGDGSSVLDLYKVTGKPIMMQNFVNIPYPDGKKQDEILIWPQDMIVNGGELWFTHGKISALFCYSLCEKRLKKAVAIPNDSMFCIAAYQALYIDAGRLFLLPYRGKKIAVYDIESDNFQMLPVPKTEDTKSVGLFSKSFSCGKYLYCIPVYYPYILKLNKETLEVTIAFNQLAEAKKQRPSIAYLNDACQIDDSHFAGVWTGSNLVLFYDMEGDTYEILHIGEEDASYITLDAYGDNLYLLNNTKHQLVVFSLKSREIIKSINIPPMATYTRSIGNGKVWLSSPHSGEEFILNPTDEKMEQMPIPAEKRGSLNYFFKHSFIKFMENRFFVYDRRRYALSVFDNSQMIFNQEINAEDIYAQIKEIFQKFKDKYTNGDTIAEEIGSDYINTLLYMIENQQADEFASSYIGRAIYEEAITEQI